MVMKKFISAIIIIKDTNPYSDEYISISELDSIKEHRKVGFIEVLVENVI
jgi:hypothetical protein